MARALRWHEVLTGRSCLCATLLLMALCVGATGARGTSGGTSSPGSPAAYDAGVSAQEPFHSFFDGVAGDEAEPGAHKALLPLGVRDLCTLAVAVLSIFIAAGGGIGGGTVLVPTYILIGGFSPRRAVALSNVTILGGAIANFAINGRRRHPTFDKPIIDWDLILVMEPTTIVGAVAGGYLNKILPAWLTLTLLTLLLGAMTWKLAAKGRATWATELRYQAVLEGYRDDQAALQQQLLAQQQQAAASPSRSAGGGGGGGGGTFGAAAARYQPPSAIMVSGGATDSTATAAAPVWGGASPTPQSTATGGDSPRIPYISAGLGASVSDAARAQLRELVASERAQVPPVHLATLLFVCVWLVASDTVKAEVPCGSWRYWTVVLSILPAVGVITLEMRRYLLWKARLKEAMGWEAHVGEITWSNRTTLLYPLLCSTAGVAAGLFGVGGGIIKGPLMLELGVMPEVAAATSATMILFTSGAASIVYLHFSYVLPDYGLALFATGFLVTLAGQLLTYKMIKVFRRRSIIIFMMVTLVAASACIMAYQAVDTLVDTAAHPKDLLHLGTICQTAGPDE